MSVDYDAVLSSTKVMGHPDQNKLESKVLVNFASLYKHCTSWGNGQSSVVFIGTHIPFDFVKEIVTTTTSLPHLVIFYTCTHVLRILK